MKKFYIFWMFVVFSLQLSAQEYCIPTYGSSSGWEYIRDFSTTGGDTNISNLGSGSSSGTAYYGDFTAMSVTAGQGTSFDFSLTYQYAGSNGVGFKIWVDWNNDFTFSEDEIVFFEFPAEDEDASDGASVVTVSGSISIPSDAVEGNHRMRVRSFDGFISDIDACQNGFWGESEDYTVSVTASTSLGCTDGYILSESFENEWMPDGWDLSQTNTTQTWNKAYYDPDFNLDGEYAADIQYDPNLELQDEWLITPSLDFTSTSNPRLEFLTRVSYYWGVLQDTYDLQVQVSTDNGVTWNRIWDETELGVPELDGWYEQHMTHQVYLDLAAYTGESNVKIAFRYYGTDGAFATIDAVKVVCCPTPLNVSVTEINLTSAIVSWISGIGQYEVEYGEAGFTQGEGTILTTDSNSIELNDLSPATTYDVYVRSVCDVPGDWTTVKNFMTRFEAVDLPYCYGFEYEDGWITENNTIGQYPSEYSFMNGKWFISEGVVEATEGTHTAAYAYSNFGQADSWYFSRGINLTAGQKIAISFDYRVSSGQYPENLNVTIGTEPNSLMQDTILWFEEGMTNENFENAETTYIATENGVYYIGFYALSDPMMGLIYLDNICIEKSEMSVNDSALSGISIYPNPVKDILNINSVKDIDKVEIYNISGQKLSSQSLNINERNIDMSVLPSGTYMVRVFLTTGAIETFKVLKK